MQILESYLFWSFEQNIVLVRHTATDRRFKGTVAKTVLNECHFGYFYFFYNLYFLIIKFYI